MSAGTLVPFLSEVMVPGDTFDIDLDTYVMTHPTIGPLFGSYKVQLDVFTVPIRLFQGKLHMNLNNAGRDMSAIKLPQLFIQSPILDFTYDVDNQQINPSCLLAYLGMRGLGKTDDLGLVNVNRHFNAVPFLGYFEIFKNYYANKQEDYAYQIHRDPLGNDYEIDTAFIRVAEIDTALPLTGASPSVTKYMGYDISVIITTDAEEFADAEDILVTISLEGNPNEVVKLTNIFNEWEAYNGVIRAWNPKEPWLNNETEWVLVEYSNEPNYNGAPKLEPFLLEDIDNMKLQILSYANNSGAFIIDETTVAPYGNIIRNSTDLVTGKLKSSAQHNQEGLLVKTYQSDLFNNWINTEWIDGTNGISEVTAVSTIGDSFTIDELNLKTKIYKMLNRIAMSDGTYDQWIEVVYDQETFGKAEIPVYEGGLIKELIFDEVVSTASASSEQATQQPLGTLAGRGKLANKHKGGSMVIKAKEIQYVMGIVSLTPRVDYSQGNRWDTNLKTMNDFHKPALDEIGFQDLITDQMAFFDTTINGIGEITYKSAGKQPAYINYMTNYNRTLGNFAIKSEQMWMTLNRRYTQSEDFGILDLTTYIDPMKFNHIFADTRRDAQNFWVQIGCDITARRKMSAKVMPNL